jgi:acetone carboxylase gamma subunit
MNERIKELAQKASDAVAGNAFSMERYNQKFAELIVRECMSESMDEIVSDEDIAQENDPLVREYLKGNNQGIVDAVIRFRNHFGVKE